MYNILLIYSEFPPVSFWGYEHALELLGKKSSMPPLGLLTVAALFPKHKYNLKVVDLNVEPLTAKHLEGIDLVGTSTMVVQEQSLREVIALCNQYNVPVMAGGPHPTTFYEDIEGVTYFLLGEVEGYFHKFLQAFENGNAKHIWRPEVDDPDLGKRMRLELTPIPRYDLIDMSLYEAINLQFSRGCPYKCEFCDIWRLYGRKTRTKIISRFIAEIQFVFDLGWRGGIFLGDDNLIGNVNILEELLRAIIAWQKAHNYPFYFYTEFSINIVKIKGLPELMVEAGFTMGFVGFETPSVNALKRTNKYHNLDKADADFMIKAVRRLQQAGMEVTGGFIQGLDGDTDVNTFKNQIDFIQSNGIVTAMVGLLTVIKGTDLYERYKREGRLLKESSGNNVAIALNYVPEMPSETLVTGYRQVISTIYDRTMINYFARCYTLIKHLRLDKRPYKSKPDPAYRKAFLRSIKRQLFSIQGPAYALFFLKVLIFYPRHFVLAAALAIKGYHYQIVARQTVLVNDFHNYVEKELSKLKYFVISLGTISSDQIHASIRKAQANIEKRRRKINIMFQEQVEEIIAKFYKYVNMVLGELKTQNLK